MTNPSTHTAEEQAAQLPGMFKRYRSDISAALRESLSQTEPHVYDMLKYYMGWVDVNGDPCVAMEGKFLRPTLCLFACQATGGSIEQAMPAAVALELIHNFSLIHDDIQDHDETRHNRKTLWAVWGVPKALVAGNVLRIIADKSLQGLVERGVELNRALAVVSLLTEAYLEMIEGQYMDILFEGQPDVGLNQYLDMIARKTGALIRCAFNMGALIGTDDRNVADAFRTSGEGLGFIFQVRDDILGVWGDEETTGKPVGADIRRKKNSFPAVYAMSQAVGGDKQQLLSAYEKDELSDSDVGKVLEVMNKIETRKYANSMASEHRDQALAALASVEMEPDARKEVEDLLQFLLVREH